MYIIIMYKSVRRDRFKRLWPKRLQKAIWHIESIGKLSEKTNYIYKPEEVKAIKSQLNKTLEEALVRFDVGLPNNIDEESHILSNKAFNAVLHRVNKIEKENKLLKDQINNAAATKESLEGEIQHLYALIAKTSDRLSREINHVKSSGRLAIPKL